MRVGLLMFITGSALLEVQVKAIEIEELEQRIQGLESRLFDIEIGSSVICGYQEKVGPRGEGLCPANNIIYDKIDVETDGLGNSLDQNDGKFTAAKAGVYFVGVSAENGRTTARDRFFIKIFTSSGSYRENNEHALMSLQADTTLSMIAPASAQRYISLEAGETVVLNYRCVKDTCSIHKLKVCFSYYGPKVQLAK